MRLDDAMRDQIRIRISCDKKRLLMEAARKLGPVDILLEFMTAAARWMMAWKLWSVLSARMAMRLNSLSLQKKFSIR